MVLALPMFGPALGLFGLEALGLMPTSLAACQMITWAFIFIKLYVEPPLCIAIFPLVGKINAKAFAKEDQKTQKALSEYRDKNGQPLL